MSTHRNELDMLVARLQRVSDEELASEAHSPQAEALFERIVGDDRERAVRRARRPGQSRRWLVIAAGLAAAIGVVFAVSVGVGPSPEAVTPAGAALREAAAAAGRQDAVPPGEYLYVRSENGTLAGGYWLSEPTDPESSIGVDCCQALVSQVRELWLGDHAGDALVRESQHGDPQFLRKSERKRWVELGRPELVAKTPFSGILAGLPARGWYHGPLDLPTDPDAIYTQFERDAEADHSGPGAPVDLDVGGSMFLRFSDVLREARATPDQRAAAYDALARVPGVILIGKTTDRFGRRGIAVAYDFLKNDPFLYRQVLVFDPKTGSLLEERREVLPGNRFRGLPPGMVESHATYEYGVAATLGEPPPAQG
jgi:hypothetical protein